MYMISRFDIFRIVLALVHVSVHLGVVQAQSSVTLVDSQDDINGILDAHNKYRAIHGVPKLSWSSTLAKDAAAWAEECRWEHDGYNRDHGENLYASWGYTKGTMYTNAAKSWYDEVALYDFNNPEKSNFDEVGHFTQMVWKSSSKLGCARVRCAGSQNGPFRVEWLYVVCRYSPPGNIVSFEGDRYAYFKQNVLKAGGDIVPPAEPDTQCRGKTKAFKLKIHGKGQSCKNGAGEAAAKAVSSIIREEYVICKRSSSCIQKPKGISYAIVRVTVSKGREKKAMELLGKAVKDTTFYDMWGLRKSKGTKYKICLNKRKGC